MGFLGLCRGGQTRGFTVSFYLNYACRTFAFRFLFFNLLDVRATEAIRLYRELKCRLKSYNKTDLLDLTTGQVWSGTRQE